MLQNVKWPHWVLLLASGLTVVATWLMQQTASGNLVLPAAAISVLTVVQMVLGLFSSSAAPSKFSAAKAAVFTGVTGAIAVMALCTSSLIGCSWFGANSQTVETDVGKDAACVLAQVLGGNVDPLSVTTACAPATLADVIAIVESLLNFYENPPADAGPDAAPAGRADPVLLVRLHQVRDAAKADLAKAKR